MGQERTIMKRLKTISENYDLAYYTNKKNIPRQELVTETLEYFKTGPGTRAFKPLVFLNLLFKQYHFVINNWHDKNIVITGLKALPLNDMEKHILFGFILKWFGGYPITKSTDFTEHSRETKKAIETEFLKYKGETPEKEFCKANTEQRKDMMKLGIAFTTAINYGVSAEDILNEMGGLKSQQKIYFSFDKMFDDIIKILLFKGIVSKEVLENRTSFLATRSRYHFEFNDWLANIKGCDCGDDLEYQKYLTEETFLEFLDYQSQEEQKKLVEQERLKNLFPLPFYDVPLANMFLSEEVINDPIKLQKFIKLEQFRIDHYFKNELKNRDPDQIKIYLGSQLRYYVRNGGVQTDWIAHTKTLRPNNLSHPQRDAFLTWIENNQMNSEITGTGEDGKTKKIKKSVPEYKTLIGIFHNDEAFKNIMGQLIDEALIDSTSFEWTDKSQGYKAKIAALIYHLYHSKYFKCLEIPKPEQIKVLAKNGFKVDITVRTIMDKKVNSLRKEFSFIKQSNQ